MAKKKLFGIMRLKAVLAFGMLFAACDVSTSIAEGQLDGLWVGQFNKYSCFKGDWSKFNNDDVEIARGIFTLPVYNDNIIFTQTHTVLPSGRPIQSPSRPQFNATLLDNTSFLVNSAPLAASASGIYQRQ